MLLVPPQYKDLIHYKRFVRSAIYGDDNMLSVDMHFISFYNGKTISLILLDFGITLTPATKSGSFTGLSTPIFECTFLKNSTGILDSKYVPLMDMDALLESLNWIRPIPEVSNDQLCEDTCNMVLMNLMFYGEEVFSRIRNKILVLRPHYKLLSFHFLKAEFFQYGIVTDPMNSFGFTKNSYPSAFIEQSVLDDEYL
jgi:hypothetical protein